MCMCARIHVRVRTHTHTQGSNYHWKNIISLVTVIYITSVNENRFGDIFVQKRMLH